MAWCAILWKAIKIRRAFNRLKRAKRNAYRENLGLPPIYPLYERPFRWIWSMIKSLILNTCCRCCRVKKGIPSSWSKFWRRGTVPNEVLKSVVGFIVGVLFTKLMLDFLTTQLNFHAQVVYWGCIAFGVLLTIGLTFSDSTRCLFILGLPQFFNSKGRMAMLAYLLVLTLSGPAKNTARNMEILTESLVCGQDMVRDSTRELVELATSPMSALKNAMNVIVTSVKDVLERMHDELTGIVKVISDVVNTIKKAYAMLKNIVNLCNSKLGSPYDRCISAFSEASANCKAATGVFDAICFPVDLFQNFCYFAKIVDLFCWLPSLVKEAIFEPLKEHFKMFAEGFKTFFDVRLNITYAFDHELKQDKSLSDIARNIKADIMGRVNWFLDYLDWTDLAISGFMFLVVWKAYTYRYKFQNSDEFDNYYITKAMVRMDLRRRRINKPTIFPLRYRECETYVQTFSWALVKEERKHMRMALVFVGIAAVQILNYLVIDYLLYLFLELIRNYGSIKIDTKEALSMTFSVEGEGFLAAMYRSILDGLSPTGGGLLPSFDTSKCLPNANPPNYYQYALIISLLLLCFLIATLEPYGLRLRHIICGWIFEDRILKRETWLYIHILSRRGNFMDYAKTQLRARLKGDRSVYQISLMDRLYHLAPFCKRCFKTHKKKCFLCGRPGDLEDFEYFIECPNCQTVYCKECFDDMGQKCLACMKKIDYEELTDFSEELGSDSNEDSDEDRDLIEICCNRLCRCSTCAKKNHAKSRTRKETLKSNPKSKSKPSPKVNATADRNKNAKKSKITKNKAPERFKDIKYQKLDENIRKPEKRKVKSVSPKQKLPQRKSKSLQVKAAKKSKSAPLLKSKSSSTTKLFSTKSMSGLQNVLKRGKPLGGHRGGMMSLPKPKKAGKSKSPLKKKSKSGRKALSTSPRKKKDKSGSRRPTVKKSTRKQRPLSKPKDKRRSLSKNKSSSQMTSKSKNKSRTVSKSKNKSQRISKSKNKRQTLSKPKDKRRTESKSKRESKKTVRTISRSSPPKKNNSSRKSRKKSSKMSKTSSSKSKSKRKSKIHGRSQKSKQRTPNASNKDSSKSANKKLPKRTKSMPQMPTSVKTSKSRSKKSKSKSKSPTKKGKRNKRTQKNSKSKSSSPRRRNGSKSKRGSHKDEDENEEHECNNDRHHQCERGWWQRDPRTLAQEKFRHPPIHISSKIRDKVDCFNEFYEDSPYPPHCNL